MAEKMLDATGLSCPLPVLKARKALRDMAPGQTLELLATDPGALDDVPAFCESAGHELLEADRQASCTDAFTPSLCSRPRSLFVHQFSNSGLPPPFGLMH